LELVIERLACVSESEFDDAYASFISDLLQRIGPNRSAKRWFPIGELEVVMPYLNDLVYTTTIPISPTLSLAISGIEFKTNDADLLDPSWDEDRDLCYICIEVVGTASRDAINRLLDDAYDISQCVSIPMQIEVATLTDDQVNDLRRDNIVQLLDEGFDPSKPANLLKTNYEFPPDELEASARNYLNFLGQAIAIGLAGSDGDADGLDNSIAVALALIRESTSVERDTVKVGLLVASIEALLAGTSKESLGETVARNVATLCCKPNDRFQMKRFVKKLYNLRSDAFHGNSKAVGENPAAVEQARNLAQAVLVGTMRWRWQYRSLNQNSAPRRDLKQQFMDSLDEASTNGTCFCGFAHVLTQNMDLTIFDPPSK